MIYCDTSYLVRLYLSEPGSDEVRALCASDRVASSIHSLAEIPAAFHRAYREGRLDREVFVAAINQLETDRSGDCIEWLDLSRSLLEGMGACYSSMPATTFLRAADALHLAEELIGRFSKERPSLAALSLCADPTALTCIANDYGYERVFSRQIEGLGRPGDVLVVFTTSGNSPNLVLALKVARERGLLTIAVLGKDGGAARGLADHELIIPSTNTARIQELHTFILHAWLTQIEAE